MEVIILSKKFIFLIAFLLLAGCSSQDEDNQNLESENTSDSSAEEAETSNDEDAVEETDTSTEEDSTDEESSNSSSDDSSADDSEIESVTEEESAEDEEDLDNESSESTSDKDSADEESTDSQVGNSKFIDVLSQDFISAYFSGPDTYVPAELSLDMNQTEVESIYGKHDGEYQLEGANLAVYGNVAILYSQYFAAGEMTSHIDPNENYINDIWIYINQPHSTILNTYGMPTVDFDDYKLYGPGDREMIYDGTRGNGYAVYIAVQNDTAMVMHKSEETDLDSLLSRP